MRLRRRFIAVAVAVVVLWFILLLMGSGIIMDFDSPGPGSQDEPVELLWWSRHMSWNYDVERQCGIYTCRITNKRKRLRTSRGVLFYGSDLDVGDFPLPRRPQHVWALLHEESPRNVPFVPHNEFLRHFHATSTFSRFSTFPLTTQYLPSAMALTSKDYFVTFAGKSSSGYRPSTSVVFLQSDCDTMTGREDYVKELMKYVEVDSYGACLQNKKLPKSLQKDYLNNLYSPELLKFLSGYKFMIAIENAACPDYITEKFWRPLVMGVVPIYFGSPTIKYWEPNKKSAIYVDDFPHPRALAKYLHEVADNETEYDSYRFHKINWQSPIKNNRLNYNLLTRRYHIGDTSPGGSLFERFECSVCRYVITTARNVRADITHYDCPIEPIYAHLESQQEPENVGDWRSMMQVGKCQAKILDTFFRRNHSYTRAEFDSELNRRMDKNDCAP